MFEAGGIGRDGRNVEQKGSLRESRGFGEFQGGRGRGSAVRVSDVLGQAHSQSSETARVTVTINTALIALYDQVLYARVTP